MRLSANTSVGKALEGGGRQGIQLQDQVLKSKFKFSSFKSRKCKTTRKPCSIKRAKQLKINIGKEF